MNKYPLLAFNVKEVITREDGLPYLLRRTLIRIGKFFSIKIHKIVMSDDACLHDHPWPFLSIILKGGYYEWTPVKYAHKYTPEDYEGGQVFYGLGQHKPLSIGKDGTLLQRTWYGPGSILWRPAKSAHRLELKGGDAWYQEAPTPCTTLVFTFKVIRKWGFFTKFGWIYWRDYTKNEHC